MVSKPLTGYGDMIASSERVNILGVGVSVVDLETVVSEIVDCALRGFQGYVCVTGAHGVIESQKDDHLAIVHNNSLLTVPDGMPNVWLARLHGFAGVTRVYGPDLMLRICSATCQSDPRNPSRKLRHFLYGSTPDKVSKLKRELEKRFPGIEISGVYSPPFRRLTEEEEQHLREVVESCRPDLFWVGLSTPKQEKFMADHSFSGGGAHPINSGVMLGVGAAFDIIAGEVKDAPLWIKRAGLQWLHRLCSEPRRLYRRYLTIVPRYIWLSIIQVLGLREWQMRS